MNRTCAAIAAFLSIALAAVPATAQITFHASGGLGRADVVLPDNIAAQFTNREAVMRMVAGAAVSFPVSGRVNLQLGADYSQKGFAGTDREDGSDVAVDIDYYEASALLDVALGGGGGASLNLLLGPTFGLQTSCTITASLAGQTESDTCEDEIIKGPDGGVVGGLRAGVGISERVNLTIGAFYNFGVLNINSGTGDDAGTITNRTMIARAGFAYRIG